jgi:hypothetical protein
MPLILAAALLGILGASINYLASRWAPPAMARLILVLSIVPMIGILIYCAVVLGLAIETNDMRYFGADMVFGVVLIATFFWVPSVYLGARIGRSNRLS